MNYIDRKLVKLQAKEIIKGKTFLIFIVCAVALILSNTWLTATADLSREYYELFSDEYGGTSDFDYYEDFDFDNPIESFEFDSGTGRIDKKDIIPEKTGFDAQNALLVMGNSWRSLIGIVFAPILVTLSGVFLALVRRDKNQEFALGKELKGLFVDTFDKTYLKKFCVSLMQTIITLALSLLLVVPGIIFSFSSYFCYEIISDNPNMNAFDAIKVSRKMVKGNRTELFFLEASFLGWYLLTGISFGIAAIYVFPYVKTVRALYYENFRMRAMQDGRISAEDFMSPAEKAEHYSQPKSAWTDGSGRSDNNGYYYNGAKSRSANTVNSENSDCKTENAANKSCEAENENKSPSQEN